MYTTDVYYYDKKDGRTFGDLGWFAEETETETLAESVDNVIIGAPELEEERQDYASGIIAVYEIKKGTRHITTLAYCTKEEGRQYGINAELYLLEKRA